MMEIQSASTFLANLLRFENRHIKVARVEMFRCTLEDLLQNHYQHHWFPEKPCKGSGYRCLRINHKMDPLIAKAGDVCGFNEEDLRKLLPNELTLWVDPLEVSYRIGENGSICVLYDGNKPQYPSQDMYHQEFPPMSMHYSQTPPVQHSSERYPGCKETVRNNRWDSFNTSPRNHHNMVEPYAAYVSS